jgi:hypothetical protein
VEDLEDFEKEVDTKHEKMVAELANLSLISLVPKAANRGPGGQLKYTKPNNDWAVMKVWQFTQLQGLVNVLTTSHGIEPGADQSARAHDNRTIKAAKTCGFFVPSSCKTKAAIDAHITTWLPKLHRLSFIVYMAMLQLILGRMSFPHKDDTHNKAFQASKVSQVERVLCSCCH